MNRWVGKLIFAAAALMACMAVASAQTTLTSAAEKILPDGIEPGYRTLENVSALEFNPFEPVSDLKSDGNSELSQLMLKRIKGYVVQSNGSPLLVIDGKSYRIKDKVPMSEGAKSTEEKSDSTTPAVAPVGGETVTILSITPAEAVFQKEDPSGFGGETFKVFFNFKHETDETGHANYNVWEPVGNGFFVNEEGIMVAPLDIVRGGELSVLTPSGYTKATLVESDSKRGIGLLKVNMKSLPLIVSEKKPELGEEIFPVGFPLSQKVGLRFLEGFVKEESVGGVKLSPEIDGSLMGCAVLNRQAEVVGILLGSTETISNVVVLSSKDSVFRKYSTSKAGETHQIPSRAAIEQSVARIFKKK